MEKETSLIFWEGHPGKLTWNPKMEVWKIILPFNWVILGSLSGDIVDSTWEDHAIW